MSNRLKQIADKAHKWWQRCGNKKLPEWYFSSIATFIFTYFLFIFYGYYVYAFTRTVVEYVLKQEIVGVRMPLIEAFAFFTILTLFMVFICLILFLGLSYLRKSATYTFKNKRKVRKIILKRDRLSLFLRYATTVFFALGYFQVFSIPLLHALLDMHFLAPFHSLFLDVIELVSSSLPNYLPVFCMFTVFSLIAYLLLNLRLSTSEKLIYIADSLVGSTESTQREHKKWKNDVEYFTNEFVTTFSKLSSFNHRIIREVDLTCLKPILLAIFLGNDKEQHKAKEMLSGLKEYLQEDESKRQANLVDWLSKTGKHLYRVFPRLKKIEDTMLMKLTVKKGLLSVIPESVKNTEIIIKILGGLIVIIGAIYSAIQILLALVGKT